MALIIYKYQFKGTNENQLHLAARLTSVKSSPSDPYNNYISYYSHFDLIEAPPLTQAGSKAAADCQTVKTGCGGYLSLDDIRELNSEGDNLDILREAKFGYRFSNEENNKLELIDLVVIPTQEDGCQDSPFREHKIAKQWKDFRPQTLEDAKSRGGTCEFDIWRRHCGTIVSNILNNEPLNRQFEEPRDQKGSVKASLENTFQAAKACSKKYTTGEPINSDDFYSRTEVLDFCKDIDSSFRLRFWEEPHPDYQTLLSLCSPPKNKPKRDDKIKRNEEVTTGPKLYGFIHKDQIPRGIKKKFDNYLADQALNKSKSADKEFSLSLIDTLRIGV